MLIGRNKAEKLDDDEVQVLAGRPTIHIQPLRLLHFFPNIDVGVGVGVVIGHVVVENFDFQLLLLAIDFVHPDCAFGVEVDVLVVEIIVLLLRDDDEVVFGIEGENVVVSLLGLSLHVEEVGVLQVVIEVCPIEKKAID